MKKKVVLYLSPMPPPAGGIATWTKRIMGLELPGGWHKELVDTKVIGGRSVFAGPQSIFVEALRGLSILMRLFYKILFFRVSVVHLNCSGSPTGMVRDLVCALAVKGLGRKLVVHYRCTTPVVIVGRVARKVFFLLNLISDAVICLNELSRSDCSESGGGYVELIPNFVDRRFLDSLPSFEVRDSVRKVVFVGGGVESKGCGVLVEVARFFPEIQFLIVGSRSEWLAGLFVPSNVLILGEVAYEEVMANLRGSDAFLFPTFFPAEGFANALLEAMACGLPCVVSDWAANKDMVEGKGGVVVPPRSVDSVVDALRSISDVELRRRMSVWNRAKVESSYVDSVVLGKYVSVYDRVSFS